MREGAGRPPRSALAGLAMLSLALALTRMPALAQEILQVRIGEPAAASAEVTVAGAEALDQVQCLIRNTAGHVRVVSGRLIASGTTVGDTTVLLLPLPSLAPEERELAVSLVRGDRELDRTSWRPVPGAP